MLSKTKKILIFSVIIVFAIALFDIFSMNSGIFGTPEDYTNGNYTDGWWNLFFKFNIILIFLASLSYYWFSNKQDKTGGISLCISSFVLWFTGLADILYFWLQGKAIPFFLYHLNNSLVIGRISHLLGFSQVTVISLFISVLIGFGFSYGIIKLLEKLN